MGKYNISNIVKTMVTNKQRFENYKEITENLASKYKKTEEKRNNTHVTKYIDENGKTVAVSQQQYDSRNNGEIYTIIYSKGLTSFSTGWQIKDENDENTDFKFISGRGYTIEDSHTNGFVDKYDEITLGNGETMTVGEFLNSQA